MQAVPTRLWTEPLTTWEGIVDAIEHQVLPHIYRQGAAFFSAHQKSLRREVEIVESASHSFPLAKRTHIVRMAVLLSGEAWVVVNGKASLMEPVAGCWIPSDVTAILHGKANGVIPSSEWLICDVTQFGALVVRCRLTPRAHYEGPIHILVNPDLPSLLLADTFPVGKRRLMAFWSLLVRSLPALPTFLEWLPRHFARIPPHLQQVLFRLHHFYMHPVRLRDIAQWSYTNPSHLCRSFRHWVGMAPLAYLTRLRMSAAWLLLSETSLSPLIVAQIVGYRNWQSFRRHFVKTFGISPSQVPSKLRQVGAVVTYS